MNWIVLELVSDAFRFEAAEGCATSSGFSGCVSAILCVGENGAQLQVAVVGAGSAESGILRHGIAGQQRKFTWKVKM